MTFEEAINLIEKALSPEHLTALQKEVLHHVWIGDSYLQMSFKLQYNHGYIKDVGAGLWRLLSEVFGEKVRKHNLRTVLARYQQQQASANSQGDQALTIFFSGVGNNLEASLNNEAGFQSNFRTLYYQALNAPRPMVAVLDMESLDTVAPDAQAESASDLGHYPQRTASADLLQNVLASWVAHAQSSQSSQSGALLTHVLQVLGQKTCLLIVKP
jgi:hypothetical protein